MNATQVPHDASIGSDIGPGHRGWAFDVSLNGSAPKQRLVSLSPQQIAATELARERIEAISTRTSGNGATIGGVMASAATAEIGWFAARPSGTEAIDKIDAEIFRGEEHLQAHLQDAQAVLDPAIGPK
jgi:phosphoglucomutase